jgi:hypothetical protein
VSCFKGHTILNPQADIDLVQDVAHAQGACVGEENEAEIRGRLVEVELVVCCSVADEGVVVATELADHVAEGEDGAEDELCVVGGGTGLVGLAGGREPGFGVDALG